MFIVGMEWDCICETVLYMYNAQKKYWINHKQIDADKIENLQKKKAIYRWQTLGVFIILKWSLREGKQHVSTVFEAVWESSELPDVALWAHACSVPAPAMHCAGCCDPAIPP